MTLNQTSVVYGNTPPDVAAFGDDLLQQAHQRFKAGEYDALEFGRIVDECLTLKRTLSALSERKLIAPPALPAGAPPPPPETHNLKHPGILKPQCPHNLLKDIVSAYLAQYTGKDQTRYTRCQTWADRLGHLSLSELNRGVIRDTLKQIASEPAKKFAGRNHLGEAVFRAGKAGISGPTQNRLVAALYAALTWALDEDVEYAPPDWQIPRVKMREESQPRDRALSTEETQRLLTAAKDSTWPLLSLVIKIAIATGARRTEISTMRWENISLDEGTVTFPHTKNGKPRTVPLLREICEALRPLAKQQGYVFTGARKKDQPFSFEAQWQDCLKRASLKGVIFHTLRHSAITRMISSGVPTLMVQEIVGHSSSHMTSRYNHTPNTRKAEALEAVFGTVQP